MMLAGILGGMAYAAIPAFLKARLEVSEILTSLMLTYVATLFLSIMVYGPWDPGYGFPQSRMFTEAAIVPVILEGTRLHIGADRPCRRRRLGADGPLDHRLRDQGRGPGPAAAASPASPQAIIWLCLLLSGGLAGLAGDRGLGPDRPDHPDPHPRLRLHRDHRAFLGRLHRWASSRPACCGALLHRRRERAGRGRRAAGGPGLFQGLLLFFLLASDFLVRYRITFAPRAGRSPQHEPRRRGPRPPHHHQRRHAAAAAGIGELVVERSGVLNLGVEGMMLAGAVTAFAVAFATGSYTRGILAACWPACSWPDLRRAHAHPGQQPGRHRPGAHPVRPGLSALVGAGFVGSPISPCRSSPSPASPTSRSGLSCSARTSWSTSRWP